MKYLLLTLGLLSASVSVAQWSVKPQVGLGYTDNANLEESAKNADFFWWLGANTSYLSDSAYYGIGLNYRSFLKEHQNDVLGFRFGRVAEMKSRSLGNYEWELAFGGQQYSGQGPATTEESFNNFYLETGLLRSWAPRSHIELTFEPIYQIKNFPNFAGRTDHALLFTLGSDWNLHSMHSIGPFAEFGFVFSNQSLYSKNYFEIGSDWRIYAAPDLKYIFRFLTRTSSFPNRVTTEATAVSNARGKVRYSSQSEIETQSLMQLQSTVIKSIGANEVRGAINFVQQSSLSGYENYSEAQVQGSWISKFDF